MNLVSAAELFDSIPVASDEPTLDIETATAFAIQTDQITFKDGGDGVAKCAGSLDSIGRAVKRIEMSEGAESFAEAYEAEGQLSHSILAELHEAILFKRENQQAQTG
jgi:hypothetical protein